MASVGVHTECTPTDIWYDVYHYDFNYTSVTVTAVAAVMVRLPGVPAYSAQPADDRIRMSLKMNVSPS